MTSLFFPSHKHWQFLSLCFLCIYFFSNSLGLRLTQRKWNQHNWHQKHSHYPSAHSHTVAFHIKKLLFYSSSKSCKVCYIHTNTLPQHCKEVKKWVHVCEVGELVVKVFAGQPHVWVGEKKKERKVKTLGKQMEKPALGPKINSVKNSLTHSHSAILLAYSICHLSKRLSGPKHPFPPHRFPSTFTLLSQVLKPIPCLPHLTLHYLSGWVRRLLTGWIHTLKPLCASILGGPIHWYSPRCPRELS